MRIVSSFAVGLCAGVLLFGCGDDSSPVDGSTDTTGTDVPRADTGPVSFSVATWNLQNFYDALDDPEKEDDRLSSAQVTIKLEAVGRVLVGLDADVLALQEVENMNILDMLADGPLAGMGYTERIIIDGFDRRGIDVACLSRVPVTNVASHLGENFPNEDMTREYFFTRDALEIFAEPQGVPVTVMVLHLRSMSDGGEDVRLAEALQARRIADARVTMGFDRFLIAGDFNDFPLSDPLVAITAGDEWTDLTVNVPIDDRWTFMFGRGQQQLDYIVGTPTMQREVDEVRILHGPEVDAASDHAPVLARFTLRP